MQWKRTKRVVLRSSDKSKSTHTIIISVLCPRFRVKFCDAQIPACLRAEFSLLHACVVDSFFFHFFFTILVCSFPYFMLLLSICSRTHVTMYFSVTIYVLVKNAYFFIVMIALSISWKIINSLLLKKNYHELFYFYYIKTSIRIHQYISMQFWIKTAVALKVSSWKKFA